MAAAPTRSGLYALLLDELRPYEGRLGASLRMALCCVIVVVLGMSQQVPEAALSCYLIFFASRDNAASGILIAIALIIAASVGILLGLVFLQFAADEPMLRLGLMAAFTFGGMYFSVATRAGPIAATVGFVFAFVMTLYDFVPIPELLSRGLSWMWVVVFFPMAALILVNALIGPNPAVLARKSAGKRLRASAALLRGEAGAAGNARKLLEEPAGELAAPARLGALFGFHSKAEAQRLAAVMPKVQALLVETLGAGEDRGLARDLERVAEAIEQRRMPAQGWRVAAGSFETAPLAQKIDEITAIWSGRQTMPVARKAEAAPADAFTNPAYMQFAIKTMLAVFITYGIYTARNWFEIHTAMITCFYVALGSTGETLHKAALRIAGCLIGAAMGIASIVFLMPHMTDIGHLLLLVAVGSFVAAWVSNGSSLVQYMGWQMALAFFLCVLQGYGPAFDISVATNRILGILIGNVVVTVVFLWLWPVSVSAGTALHLGRAVEGLAGALRRAGQNLAGIMPELDAARHLSRLSAFEASRLRIRSPLLPHARTILDASEAAVAGIADLRLLRERPRYLFGAPRCVKAATLAQEESAARFLDDAASAIVRPEPEAKTMLDLSLSRSFDTLARLERQLARAPRRASWRGDLEATAAAHRDLLQGFARTIGAL